MKCIIIDDEELAREGMERYISQVPFLELIGSYENAIHASEAIKSKTVDLMLLDIQMPHLTGIEFLKGLSRPPLVIFHTAFPNFALESYQLDVIDYLVKPITFDRFHQAVSKAYEYFQFRSPGQTSVSKPNPPRDFVFIKCETRYEKVKYQQVMYIEAMQNYSLIQTTEGKLITLNSLKKMEEIFPTDQFLRVHRSFIVSLERVEAIEGNQVRIGQRLIPVSKEAREEVRKRLLSG